MAAGEKLLRSLVAMAAADGQIDRRELELIDNYRAKWGVEPEALQRCIDDVQAGNTKITLPKDEKSRKIFLKALVKVAAIDGVIDPGEKVMLRSVAAAMSVSEADLNAMLERALSKTASDDRTRVDSDPRLEASTAPAAGPGSDAPPDAEELFAYIAYKQSRGEPVPPELMELAALLMMAKQAQHGGGGYGGGGYGGHVGLSNQPLRSNTPAWLQKMSTKQKAIAAGVVVGLWLLIPTMTGLIAGSSKLSDAEDNAELIAVPTSSQVQHGRQSYENTIREQTKRREALEKELAQVQAEAAKAKEAPQRLRRFGSLRNKRWLEFRDAFPTGPKQGDR